MRTRLALCIYSALALGAWAAGQEAPTAPVVSAAADNQVFERQLNVVYFDLVNLGTKTITASFLRIYCTAADGTEHFVGRSGQDMIDYPDPMPESGADKDQVRPFGRVEPLLRKRTGRNIFGCADAPVVNARVDLEALVFDDGSSEGKPPQQQNLLLEARKIRRRELAKWVDRFTELRHTVDLSTAARGLYQDLVAANHESDQDPDVAARNQAKTAGGVRDELQDLALQITQYAKTHKTIDDLPDVLWRITELEKRNERLKLGAGSAESEH